MGGIVVCNVDSAGGIIRSVGQSKAFYKGNPLAVVGDRVESHGKSPHNNATLIQGSSKGSVGGKALVLEGSKASCGHQCTGRPGMTSTG